MDTTPAAAVAAATTALWPSTETKHEIDADMMPPPITTQMPMIVRRPSLNTSQPLITDQQLVHLNAVVAAEALKTELMDESSQTSIAEAMHSPETGVPGCSAVGGGMAGPQSPNALQYHSRYGRKASMDAIMFDNNSMPGFPVAPAAPTPATSMEVAVAAAVEMAVKNEIAKAVSVAKVDKFITDLAQSANVADATDPVQEPSLFGVSNDTVAAHHALTDILTTPQATVATAAAAAAAAAVVLERSLSNSSASSSSTQGSPMAGNSPANSLTSHNSPITQDIILNSEPSVQLTPALPLQQLVPTGSASVAPEVSQAAGLSTDIIMNPSVSPSTILCSDNGAATAVVPNIMAPHQVTMANSILNDIAMQAQPTQQDAAVAALALSNIIMTSPSDTAVAVPPAPAPEVSTATSTAVSNMIIKAAADFISNHEQQTQQHHHHNHNHTHSISHSTHAPQQQMMSSQSVTNDPLACNPLNLLLNHNEVVAPSTQASVTTPNNETVATQFPSLGM